MISREMAEHLIATYCNETPRADAVARLMALPMERLQEQATSHWVQVIPGTSDTPALGLEQNDLDSLLYEDMQG